jgi:hypothetical protein
MPFLCTRHTSDATHAAAVATALHIKRHTTPAIVTQFFLDRRQNESIDCVFNIRVIIGENLVCADSNVLPTTEA